MCSRFGCNPRMNFSSFFSQFELNFLAQLLPKHIYTLVTPPTILPRSLRDFVGVLSRSEDMHQICCNPQFNPCRFL